MQLLPASSFPSHTCYESAFEECRHSRKQKKSTEQNLHRHRKYCGKIFSNCGRPLLKKTTTRLGQFRESTD